MYICVCVIYVNIRERQSQKGKNLLFMIMVVSIRSNGKLQSGSFLQHIWRTLVYIENSEALKLSYF